MSWLDGLRDRLYWLFRSKDAEERLDSELQFHLEMETERLIASGLAPEAAAREAARSLGNMTSTKETVRDERGVSWIEDLGRDLAYAARGLRRRPGFTFAVLATLALGIGANTAVFSVAEGVALRPLAFEDPARLVAVWPDRVMTQFERNAIVEQTRTLAQVAGYASWNMAFTGVEEPTQLRAARTSANLFEVLGARAALGRTYHSGEDAVGADPVAVLSDALWKERFHGDSTVVGRSMDLDGLRHTIIGVMPATFEVARFGTQVWVPLPDNPEAWYYRSNISLLIGRLAPTVTPEAASADFTRVIGVVRQQLGYTESFGEKAALVDFRTYVLGDYRILLLVLLGAVSGILLLAGANLANLLLGRADSRRPELSMRLALGARRSRLVRQLLTEGLALSLIGSGLGLLLAVALLGVFRAIAPPDTPRIAEVGINPVVLAVCAASSVVMALVFGLAQAVGGLPRADGMRPGLSGGTRVTARAGGFLVVLETALAVTLIIGAGPMIRTIGRLALVDPGFDPRNVLTLRVQPVAKPAQVDAFYQAAFERIAALPGVVTVGAVQHLPMSGIRWDIPVDVEGRPTEPGKALPTVGFRLIGGDYLGAVGIPLKAGRAFDARDTRGGMPVAIVNEAMAERYWPGESPVGRRLHAGRDSTWTTVVGVVGDVRHSSLTETPEPEMYTPTTQAGMPALMVAVRTSVPPASLAKAVQAAVWEVDPGVPVARVMPYDDILRDSVGDKRLLTLVLGVFAVVALVVGAIGVFGVVSFAVSRRTREIGIRMALGATRGTVRGAVFGRGMTLVVGGIALGVVAALGLTRFLRSFLFEVGTTDPVTFVGVASLLALVASAAIAGPAVRATRVDPVRVLRDE
ncbi:MAG TPA: ABC transporter permease [Gemmatimonadales bacterium]|nr:ABC transporter permease [Gemmatimonadales bacterium]